MICHDIGLISLVQPAIRNVAPTLQPSKSTENSEINQKIIQLDKRNSI